MLSCSLMRATGAAWSETPSHASVATATVAASTRATAVASAPSARLAVSAPVVAS